MFRKPPSSAAPPSPDKVMHPDYARNKADAIKLIEFWEPKIQGHKSKLRFHAFEELLYLTYNRIIDGVDCVYSSPHPYNQPWDEFRGSVTACMRYCEILGARDDSQASSEWRRKHGVKVTMTKTSHSELWGLD